MPYAPEPLKAQELVGEYQLEVQRIADAVNHLVANPTAAMKIRDANMQLEAIRTIDALVRESRYVTDKAYAIDAVIYSKSAGKAGIALDGYDEFPWELIAELALNADVADKVPIVGQRS